MELHTKRLLLRAPRKDDLDEMHKVYSDPSGMRYWSTPPHDSISETQNLLDRRTAAWKVAPINFQIELGGAYVGNAGNFFKDEIGFMLHPKYWRQGIVTEAMTSIIPYLFGATDHQRLTADADPLNTASVALLKSLGFRETHRAKNTFCINGVWSDSVYLALPRPA